MTNLQPRSFWKWRCTTEPFEVVVPGRLEGEVLALGVQDHHDARCLIRRLQTLIKEGVPVERQLSFTQRSKGSVTGLPYRLTELFNHLNEDGNQWLDEGDLVVLAPSTAPSLEPTAAL